LHWRLPSIALAGIPPRGGRPTPNRSGCSPLAQQAERGLLDFLTIEDGLDLQSDDRFRTDARLDRVRGRLDAC
jgi:hypothetical protein